MSDKIENFTEEIRQEWSKKKDLLVNAYREVLVDNFKKAGIEVVPAITRSETKKHGVAPQTDKESIDNLLIEKQDADDVLEKIGINKKQDLYKELHDAINDIQNNINANSSLIYGMFGERLEKMRIMTLNSLKNYKKKASMHIEALSRLSEKTSTPSTEKDYSKLPQLILSDLNQALKILHKSKTKTDQYIDFLNNDQPNTDDRISRYKKNNQPLKHLTSLKIWIKPVKKLYAIFLSNNFSETDSAQYVAGILIHLYPEIWGKENKAKVIKRVRDRNYRITYPLPPTY